MKTISVLGLLPSQANIIAAKYKDKATFKFVDGNGATLTAIRNISDRSDAIFMRTRHANHGTFNLLKRCGAVFTMVSGGMTSLDKKIEEYLDGNKE